MGVSCYCMILLKGKWEGSIREQREPLWGRSIQKSLHHCVKKKLQMKKAPMNILSRRAHRRSLRSQGNGKELEDKVS